MWLFRQELFPGEKLLVRLLVNIFVLLRVIFLLTIYLISGIENHIRFPTIGVADAYALDPARAVGAFIIPISGMLILTVIWLRLRRIRFLLHAPSHWASWIAIAVLLIVQAIGLFGLGAVTPAVNPSLFYVVSSLWYAGAITTIMFTTLLNWQVSLIQPTYLRVFRRVVMVLVLLVALALALTIGWQFATAGILEIVLSTLTAVYALSYLHDCEFPMRSSCPFAYRASIPPLPPGKEEHASLFIKEAD